MNSNHEKIPPFDAAYSNWLQKHVKSASGERKRRLVKGLGYSEKWFVLNAWLPAFGNLQHLHPEFEVIDFKDGFRYLDFAYIHNGLRICIEIDPYGTHLRDIDRWKYADNLTRQNHLVIDDWKVLRFSLDDLKENTRQCQQLLHQALGKWGFVKKQAYPTDHPIDMAILSLLGGNPEGFLSPSETARQLGWHRITISIRMKRLWEQGYLHTSKAGQQRNRKYRLNPDYSSPTSYRDT